MASPTRKGGDCPADAYQSDPETPAEFFVHSKRSYYHHAPDDAAQSNAAAMLADSARSFGLPRESLDALPHRFVAGKQFFNYHAFGSLREGLEPVSLLSKAHFGLAVTAVMAGLCFTFLRYGYRPLLVAYLSRHHPSQYNAAKYLLDWPGAFSVFIGLFSDCLPLRGSRRKAYILLGWFVSVFAFAGIAITNLFGASTIVVYDDNTELAYAADGRQDTKEDRWVFGVLYVALSFIGCFAVQVAWVAASALIIEYAQREPLYKRGHIASLFLILYYGAALVVQGVITQLLFPTEVGSSSRSDTTTKTALQSVISLSGAGLILAIGAAVALPFAYYMLDEDSSSGSAKFESNSGVQAPPLPLLARSPSPKGSPRSSSSVAPPVAASTLLARGVTQLWRFCQQNVVYRILLFLFAYVMLVGIYNQNVRDALARWCGISAADALMVEVVKSGFTLVGLLHAKQWMLNMGWKVVGSLGVVLFVAIFLTETLPIVFNAVRARWFYMLTVGVLEWPKCWLKLYSMITPTEIATAGAEGATIGMVLSFYVISIAAAHTASEGLSLITGTSVTMGEVDSDAHATRMAVLTNGLVYYAVNLAGLVSMLWLPHSKLDAQQLRAFGGYSRGWGASVVTLFLVLLVFVLVVNVAKMASSS
jgi:hypothetical protein